MLGSFALASWIALAGAPTEGVEWVADYDKAKKMAAEQGKDLLINFTGSDWCGWCIRLDEEVFSQPAFVEKAPEDFIFVYLDFPNSEEKKAAVVDAELNNKLSTDFAVAGFPTIILADASGRPYGRTGYAEGGPEKYLESLDEMRKGGQAIKKLLAAEEPTEELLMAAFPALADQSLLGYPDYAPFLEMARKMDADGKKGMRAKIMAIEQNQAFEKFLEQMLGGGGEPDWDKMAAFLAENEYLSGASFIQIGMTTAMNHLVPNERFAEAKSIFERVAAMPELKGNAEAQTELAKLIKDMTEKIEAAKSGEGEGEGDG